MLTSFLRKCASNTSVAAVEVGTESLNTADLDTFFVNYSPTQYGQRPIFVSIDGGKCYYYCVTPLNGELIYVLVGISNYTNTNETQITESNLDFQYAMGLLGEEAQVVQYQVTNMRTFSALILRR